MHVIPDFSRVARSIPEANVRQFAIESVFMRRGARNVRCGGQSADRAIYVVAVLLLPVYVQFRTIPIENNRQVLQSVTIHINIGIAGVKPIFTVP